jgi:PLP dependent protein
VSEGTDVERARIVQAAEEVRGRVAEACRRSGRPPDAVRIVAISKGVSAEAVRAAVGAGIVDVGENRGQEFRDKYREIGDLVRWHFVGPIQTNKVRYLDPAVLIHGVDRLREAEALQERADRLGREWDVLVEVNVSGERTKQGVAPERVEAFLADLGAYPRLHIKGLMFMAPKAKKPEDVRWVFSEGRRLRDRLSGDRGGLEELSMGMSDDYEVAIEEGATLIRVGRAIFRKE